MALIERVIYTIFNKIARYFTANDTTKWVDILQPVIDSYNNTYHTTIRGTPAGVNENNIDEVYAAQYIAPMIENN